MTFIGLFDTFPEFNLVQKLTSAIYFVCWDWNIGAGEVAKQAITVVAVEAASHVVAEVVFYTY